MSRTCNDFRQRSSSINRRSRMPQKKRLNVGSLDWHACRHEVLEDRRLLAVVPFSAIANELRDDLQAVETLLVSRLNNFSTGTTGSLPFVGEHLGDVSKAISGFSSQIQTALAALGNPTDPSPAILRTAIFDALGPGGLNILGDRNGNGVDLNDIVVSASGPVLNDDFAVQMKLQGTVAAPAVPLTFDTGLPGLPLSIRADGELVASVNFTYELAFNYDAQTQAVDLDNTKKIAGTDHQMALAVGIGLQDFSATAIMGFVQGDLTAISGQPNGLSLNVQIDELGQSPDIAITGSADANLELDGGFAGTENAFPGIDTQLHLHWSLDSENPNIAPPDVWFSDVYLDLGDFISNVVGPVFEKIHFFTQPLAPVLEVLGYPLPVLTDLSELIGGGEITLLDLGSVAATFTGFGPLYDLVEKVLEVIEAINQFEVGDSVKLKLGGFDLDSFDLRNVAAAGNPLNTSLRNLTELSPSNLIGIGQSLASQVDQLPIGDDEKELLKGLAAKLNNGFNLSFPILEDPASAIFPMLLGRDGDLFTLDAEVHQSADGGAATGLSVFGIGVAFGGDVEIDSKFKFAYDTFGLRNLISDIAAGNTSAESIGQNIIDGFYLASDSYFELAGSIFAAAGAGIGVFSARVGGFISTGDSGNVPVSITIDDPNNDGKLRFSEFSEDSFEFSGELAAELGVEVRIGVEILGEFVGIKKRFNLAREVIIDFNADSNNPTSPSDAVLASPPDQDGNITLYIGQLAHLREEVDTEDGNEQLRIQHVASTDAGETIDITILQYNEFGLPFDVTQRIEGVRKITGIDAVGNLRIDVLPGVTSDVHFEGGSGHAELMYEGLGIAYLKAGALDSELIGGLGNNTLIGGPGNDVISLGHAANTVSGGAGNNKIIVNAPTTQGGSVVGGDTSNNMLVVSAGEYTSAIDLVTDSPGYMRLAYDDTQGTYPNLIFSNFNRVTVTAQDRSTDVHVGDLSPAGIETVVINVPTLGDGGRQIELGTRYLGGTSDISLQPFDHEYSTPDGGTISQRAVLLANNTTGVETYILGVAPDDVTTILQHGGSATLGPLGNDNGTIVFDARQRSAGASETVFMHVPSDGDGNIVEMGDSGADFKIDPQLYPTIVFKGFAPVDRIEMDLEAPATNSATNTVTIDASGLQGLLDLDLLGVADLLAVANVVTISALAVGGVIDVHGGATDTNLNYGAGRLTEIAGDVRVHNVQLTVDNHDAVIPSLILFGTAAALRRTSPDDGIRPGITYDGLRGKFNVYAGPGDRVGLEQTAPGIERMLFFNSSGTLDPLYVEAASVDLEVVGNWSLYFGREMFADGSVARTSKLAPISVNVAATFSGDNAREIVLDAALDPTGAEHTLRGRGVEYLRIYDSLHGLNLKASGTTLADDLFLFVTGADVDINLPGMAKIEITVDSNDRFAGINPTAPNNVSVLVVMGTVNMFPTGEYDSRIEGGNPVNLLATIPVDTTNVLIDSSTTLGVVQENSGAVFAYGVDFLFADAYYFADVPAGYWQLVDEVTFGTTVSRIGAWADAWGGGARQGELPYGIYTPSPIRTGFSFDQTWLDPTSNYNPPLPTEATAIGYLYPRYTGVTMDSTMNLNASQVRGQFNVNVIQPDYELADHYAEFFEALTAYTYARATGGIGYTSPNTPYPRYAVHFGKTQVNLTHVGTETTAHVGGNAPLTDYYGLVRLNETNLRGALVQASTHVNVGAGNLSNIAGAISFSQVHLTIDGRNSTTPNILTLNGNTFSGWAGDTLASSFGTLYGTLNIIGGAADSFSILQTPTSPAKVSIQNAGPPIPAAMSMAVAVGDDPVAESLADEDNLTPGVYLVGKTLNQTFEVNGHFEFYIGRKLNQDGSVEVADNIDGFTNFENNSSAQHTILYNFVGEGQGKLVYDVASEVTLGPSLIVRADAAHPGKGVLVFDWGSSLARNKLVYSPNTDLTLLAPQRQIALIENFVAATIRVVLNPLNTTNFFDEVRVGAAYGPVFVTGRGNTSFVTIAPLQFSAGRLDDSIRAAVTVTDAALRVIADEPGTPVGGPLLDIVLTSNSLTGLAGAPIYFERLTDYTPPANSSQPGLHLGLPKQGSASLTILDTPADIRTAISTFNGVDAGTVLVHATTGPLLLGSMNIFNNSYLRNGFSAMSVTFGSGGSLQNIRGNVATVGGSGGYNVAGGTFFDNRFDAPREVLIQENLWSGLAPASFQLGQTLGSEFTILGSDDSYYRVEIVRNKVHLMAGEGTTVESIKAQFAPAYMPYGMVVYGAEQVLVNPGESNPATSTDGTFTVLPHPDRPTETTELIVDFRSVTYPLFVDNAGGGFGELWGGNIPFKNTYVKFQGNATHLTLLGFNRTDWEVYPFSYPIQVVDTVALSTTINPGNRLLEVLGTSNPLTIEHDGPQKVTLGDAGNMQNLHGSVTVNVRNSAAANVVIELNSSADATPRNINLSHPAENRWLVSGLAPVIIDINGALARPSLRGGVGANTLTGPNEATTWDITSASGGLIEGLISFSGISNLIGGSASDDFYFRGAGQLAGNLNGGGGFDTAHYIGILNGSETIDLGAGILPRVAGQAISIEAVNVVAALAVQNPGNQIGHVGVAITPVQIVATGGDPNRTYSATGLPAGLSIHPTTGVISGTISSSIAIGTNFNVNVTVNDGSTPQSVSFTWSVQDVYFVVNPGNQLTPEGVPIHLQIQVSNPTNIPLRFDANGLPSYLSINPQTGVISGTIYFYTQQYGPNIQFNANVFVYDDAGGKVKTVSFTWRLQPGFQLYAGIFHDYAGETIDFPVLTNPYNHDITVTATGLPPGLSMDSSGRITGTIDNFGFSGEAYVVQITAFDATINYTATQTLLWNVVPAMDLYEQSPAISYAGMDAEYTIYFQNALGHEFTLDVTNLPPGLSVDEMGVITGTVDVGAATGSPYTVTVTLTNTTIGYSMEKTFEWTVLPPISIEDLNANTPPGTPILVDVFDPMAGNDPQRILTVHYPSQAEGMASIYVRTDQLWVIENGQRTAVTSIDPNYPELGYATDLLAVPGRGLLMVDNESRLWFITQAGGKVIHEGPIYLSLGQGGVEVGDSIYVNSYESATFRPEITRIDFSGAEPQVSTLDTSTIEGIESVRAFAGGVVFNGYETGNSYRTLYWYNPATGQTTVIGGWAIGFNDVTVVPLTNGTESLFTFARPDWDLPTELRVVNSADLSGGGPQLATLAAFPFGTEVSSGSWPEQRMHVTGNKVSFSTRTYDGETNEYSFQFWTSDGTVGGTSGVSSFMIGNAQITEQVAFAGSVYFFYRLNPAEVTETTVVAQLWKFDPESGELALLRNFQGELHGNRPPQNLAAVGEHLYFAASNGIEGQYGLWRLKAGSAAPSLVPSKAGNAYANPDPLSGFAVGDRFYFLANAVALPNDGGYLSRQVWSVGPPLVVSVPGDLTGDGVVSGPDIDTLSGLIQANNPAADLNGDGLANQGDLDYLIREILETQYGDANLDGFVDAADLAITRQRIGSQYGGPNWLGADFNGDGIVDAVDLATVRQHMGFAGVNAVPVGTQPLREEMIGNDTRVVIDENLDHDFDDLISLLASGTARRRWRLTRTS